MGNGPFRVWKNRMKGNQFGVWQKEYNTTETGEIPFLYPEFKGYHSNMYWCKFIGKEKAFTVVTENEDIFFRLFTPAFNKILTKIIKSISRMEIFHFYRVSQELVRKPIKPKILDRWA